jgi:hypothetical protein
MINNDSLDTWAESAYHSAKSEEMLKNKNLNSKVYDRAYRNNLLSKKHIVKSKTKVRVIPIPIFNKIFMLYLFGLKFKRKTFFIS